MKILEIVLNCLNFLLTMILIIYSIYWYKLDSSIIKLEPLRKRLQEEKDFANKNSNSKAYIEISTKVEILSAKIEKEKYWREKCVYLMRKYGIPLLILKLVIDLLSQLNKIA